MGRTATCTGPSYSLHVSSRRIRTCWCAGCVLVSSCWYLGHSILLPAGQRTRPCSLSRVQWIHLDCHIGVRGSSIDVQSRVWIPVRCVVRSRRVSHLGYVGRVGPVVHDRIEVHCSSCLFHHEHFPRSDSHSLDHAVAFLPSHCHSQSATSSSDSPSVVVEHIRVVGWVVP